MAERFKYEVLTDMVKEEKGLSSILQYRADEVAYFMGLIKQHVKDNY